MSQSLFDQIPLQPVSVTLTEALPCLENLQNNPNIGSGLILGLSHDEKSLIQISWNTGLLDAERSAMYKRDLFGRVYTNFNRRVVGADTDLLIYDAMNEDSRRRVYVVSNGRHTSSVLKSVVDLGTSKGFYDGLAGWQYKSNHPNFSSRVVGLFSYESEWLATMALIRAGMEGDCERHYFNVSLEVPGYGLCLPTYIGGEEESPFTFEGSPCTVPLCGTNAEIINQYWNVLHPHNRLSLAVKFINIQTGQSEVRVRTRES